MLLSEFKKSIGDIIKNNQSKKVNLTSIGGKDTENYGDLLIGINHYISIDPNIDDIILTSLTLGSDEYTSIVIDGRSSSNLLTRMKKAYEFKNKATTSGNQLKMLRFKDKNADDKNQGDSDTSDQNIKDVVFGKFKKFAEPSIDTGYGPLQATTQSPYAESEEEKTNILIEEINRIKQLLK